MSNALPEQQEKQQKSVAANPPLDQKPRIKLPAEITFDRWAYGGISYAAQALTGIFLSRSIKHGWLNKPFRQLSEWITKKPAKEPSTTLVITVMIMVGNTFLLPLKWIENRKPKIVRWIQDRTNARHPPTPEERAFQEEQLAKLDREPKQTWWSLLGGRGFGLGVVYAANWLIGDQRNTWLQDKSAHYIQKGFGAVGLKKMAQSEVLGQYLKIGFVDSFYSMVSAGGLYVYSHFIRPPKKHKASPESNAEEVVADVEALTVPAAIEHSAEKQASNTAAVKSRNGSAESPKDRAEQFAAKKSTTPAENWQAGVAKTDAENPSLSPAM